MEEKLTELIRILEAKYGDGREYDPDGLQALYLAKGIEKELARESSYNKPFQTLEALYTAWANHGPESPQTVEPLNKCMEAYDEWLD